MNRYYSTIRPVSIGTFPKNENYVCHHNYDQRTFCDDIQKNAWGYIEYSKPLTEKEISSYDLVDGNKKKYYAILFRANTETGKITAKLYKETFSAVKPEDEENYGKRYNTMICWYDNKKEAEDSVSEVIFQ